MQKASQHIKRITIHFPASATREDVIRIINEVNHTDVVPSLPPKTYEIRRKEALPLFRMFTVPSKKNTNFYGKNIFRLFG